MKVKELMEQRAAVMVELEEITKNENFEQVEFDEKRVIVEKIDEQLRALKDVKKLENIGGNEKMEKREIGVNDELRAILNNDVAEMRALNLGTANKGGVAVAESFGAEIIKETIEQSNVASHVKNTRIAGNIKVLSRTNSSAGFMGEMAPITAEEFEMAHKELKSNRLGKECVISYEMLNAQGVDLAKEIREDITCALGQAIERAVFKGTGTGQPLGILVDTDVKVVSPATPEAISIDDIKDLKHAIKSKFLAGAKWYMNAETFAAIDKLKDATGKYLLQESVASETGYVLMGHPVHLTDELAKGEVVFMNPAQAYQVNTQPKVYLVTSTERMANVGCVVTTANMYLDGRVINPEAVAVIK